MTKGIPPEGEKKSSRAVTDDIFSKFKEAISEAGILDAETSRKLLEVATAEAQPTPARIEAVLREDGSQQ